MIANEAAWLSGNPYSPKPLICSKTRSANSSAIPLACIREISRSSMPLEPAGAAPCGHVAAQLIGFARRVVRRHDRQAHHLLLKERHAPASSRAPAPGTGADRSTCFFPVPPAQIRMDHAARDRPGPHDADLNDEVVIAARLQARQHRHLRARLDLKDPDRLRLADHVVGRTRRPRGSSRSTGRSPR